ncbi:MAG: twin-arginine translocase TatA/TatE family subunit [Lentisphaerae bacterium]|nr:twin-arginine translocase TatA/TatE family subunit [Lentisphaerota bacterium]
MKLAFITPGYGEILLIFLAILLLFGAKKLPGLARALGKSLGEFKKGKEEGLLKNENKDAQSPDDENNKTDATL